MVLRQKLKGVRWPKERVRFILERILCEVLVWAVGPGIWGVLRNSARVKKELTDNGRWRSVVCLICGYVYVATHVFSLYLVFAAEDRQVPMVGSVGVRRQWPLCPQMGTILQPRGLEPMELMELDENNLATDDALLTFITHLPWHVNKHRLKIESPSNFLLSYLARPQVTVKWAYNFLAHTVYHNDIILNSCSNFSSSIQTHFYSCVIIFVWFWYMTFFNFHAKQQQMLPVF